MTDEPADAPADEAVLEPEDLDVTGSERVRELDENRFVVSLSEDGTASKTPLPDDDPTSGVDDVSGDTTEETASGSVDTDPLAAVSAPYAVSLVARTEGREASHVVRSHSVVDAFEEVLLWYAAQLGDDGTPPEEALRILLDAADLDA